MRRSPRCSSPSGLGVGLWGGASGAILIRAGVDAVDVRRSLDRLHRRLSHRHVGGRGARASLRRRAGAFRLGDHLRRDLVRAARRLERGLGRDRSDRRGVPRRRGRRPHERRGRADRAWARPPDPGPAARRRIRRHGAWRDPRQFDRRRPRALGRRHSRRARARRRGRRLPSGGAGPVVPLRRRSGRGGEADCPSRRL